jgi:2Fe-2S ferredoxin
MSKIKVTWVTHDGRRIEGDVAEGHNFMEAAIANNVPGILGDCGGALSCATCHVVVTHTPAALDGPDDAELELLELGAIAPVAGSRLSCQLVANPALSGITLQVPGP